MDQNSAWRHGKRLIAAAFLVAGLAAGSASMGQGLLPAAQLDAAILHASINEPAVQPAILLAQNSPMRCTRRNTCNANSCQEVQTCCDVNDLQNCRSTNIGQPTAVNAVPATAAPAVASSGRMHIGVVRNHCDTDMRFDFLRDGKADPSVVVSSNKRRQLEVPRGTYDVRVFVNNRYSRTRESFVVEHDGWDLTETCEKKQTASSKQETVKLIGKVGNSCKTHEVRFDFMADGKVQQSFTTPPGKSMRDLEVLRGTYKVRIYERRWRTSSVAVEAMMRCDRENEAAGQWRHSAMAQQKLSQCNERASRSNPVGAYGDFTFAKAEEAFEVSADGWNLSHACAASRP